MKNKLILLFAIVLICTVAITNAQTETFDSTKLILKQKKRDR